MATIEELTLAQIEELEARVRARKQALKRTNKVAERKITTLMRRRERIMDRVREIDAQIDALRNAPIEAPAPKRRGRRPKAEVVV
jgi:chromosome segregation ATPase